MATFQFTSKVYLFLLSPIYISPNFYIANPSQGIIVYFNMVILASEKKIVWNNLEPRQNLITFCWK